MRTLILIFTILVTGCLPIKREDKKNEKEKVNPDGSKVIKSIYPNGKPKAEVIYKGGKKNGLSKSYDKEGNIMLELPYVNDKKEGQSKKYYEGGKQIYSTTEYKDNNMHGLQVKYRENGDLMSEAKYKEGNPCIGIKEYYKDNTLKNEYPKIIITPIDQIESNGLYYLDITISERARKVKYYMGTLKDGCVTSDLYFIQMDESTDKGRLRFEMPPGAFRMEEINIIATMETIYGNTYITQRKYNLAIDNQ
jgi:hypothetical protein